MAEAKVGVIIEAEDKASSVLSGIQGKLSSFQKGVNDLQPAFKQMAMVGGAAFAAISGVAVTSLKAFAEAEKDMTIANQALGNSLDSMSNKQLEALHTALGKPADDMVALQKIMDEVGKSAIQLGFDDEEASKAFAKLFQVSKDVTQAQKDLKLAEDLSAFSGRSLEESASAITKVHAGTTKVLKDFGIKVKDGTTSLEALNILETQVTGTAEKMSKTAEVQMKILTLQFSNMQEAIGRALAPELTKLLQYITPVIEKITSWAEKNPDLLAKIILIAGAIAGLVLVMGTLGIILGGVVAFFASGAAMIMGVVAVIGISLVPVIMLLIRLWPELVETVKTAFYNIGETILAFWTAFKVRFDTVFVWLKVYWLRLQKGFTDVWTAVKDTAKSVFDSITGWLKPIIRTVENLLNKLAQIGQGVGKNVKGFFGNVWGGAKDLLGIDDGIVQNGQIITTNPADYIMATKDPQSLMGGTKNININISGAVLTREAAQVMGDMIISQLRLNMRL